MKRMVLATLFCAVSVSALADEMMNSSSDKFPECDPIFNSQVARIKSAFSAQNWAQYRALSQQQSDSYYSCINAARAAKWTAYKAETEIAGGQ